MAFLEKETIIKPTLDKTFNPVICDLVALKKTSIQKLTVLAESIPTLFSKY